MSSSLTSPVAAAPARALHPRLSLFLLGYFAALTLAEALTSHLSMVSPGLLLHGLLLMILLLQAAFTPRPAEQRLYLTLAFAPLIRLVSLSMPLRDVPRVYWYLLVGAPLFLSALLVGRYAGFSRTQLGLTARFLPVQLIFGAAGLGLGYIEYLILRPEPLAAGFTLAQVWQPAFILLIFTGALEELIFRGLLQSAFNATLGRFLGLLYVSALFAVLHLGYQSALDVLFVFAVALVFGLFTLLTQSILGATLAHGLTNISLFLVFPFLLAQPAGPVRLLSPGWLSAPPPIHRTPLPSSLPAASSLLVDDGDPSFQHTGGQRWLAPEGSGGDLVWALSTTDRATAQAVWSVEIQDCGLYRVEAYIPREYGATRSLTYQVLHRHGEQPVVVDQLVSQGAWLLLGEFSFDAGQSARVTATNLTGEDEFSTYVAFDALRWVLLQPCPP